MSHEPQPQADGHADALPDLLHTIIADSLDVMRLEIMPGTVLVDDLGATDHDLDRLRRQIERKTGVYVPLEAVQHWRQVADVVSYVEGRMPR